MYFILLLFYMVYATLGVDLECYNDYCKTMDCSFSPGKANCSEFTLQLHRKDSTITQVALLCEESKASSISKCQCPIKVEGGFIITEVYEASLNLNTQITKKTISIEETRKRLVKTVKEATLVKTVKVATQSPPPAGAREDEDEEDWVASLTVFTIKPKAPTIPAVKRTPNGNYLVSWQVNYCHHLELSTQLTYKKKGQEKNVTRTTTSLQYDILASELESGTEYVVSIRTFSVFSHILSDSSEASFSTPVEPPGMFITLIVVACTVVFILTVILFKILFRFKDKLWEKFPKYAKPDLLSMVSAEPKILSPPRCSFCSVNVDSPEMDFTEGKPWSKCSIGDGNSRTGRNGTGTDLDSSSLGYAHTCPVSQEQDNAKGQIITHVHEALSRIFPNLAPAEGSAQTSALSTNSSLTDDGSANMTWSGLDRGPRVCPSVNNPYDSSNDIPSIPVSSSYDNMTYLSAQGPVVSNTLCCEFAYHSSGNEGTFSQTCPTGQPDQDLQLSSNVAPLMQTDFSYQPCANMEEDVASSERNVAVPHSLPSVVAGYQSFGDVVSGKESNRGTDVCGDVPLECTQDVCSRETLVCDVNPCYAAVPTPEFSLPPSDGAYQPLQSLVEHRLARWTPDLSGKQQGLLDECQESQFPESVTETMPFKQCQGGLGGSFLTSHTSSPYHCV